MHLYLCFTQESDNARENMRWNVIIVKKQLQTKTVIPYHARDDIEISCINCTIRFVQEGKTRYNTQVIKYKVAPRHN